MDAIDNDIIWRDLFYTELTTGLRRGELCGLKWTDFDERDGTLKINRSVSHDKNGGIVEGETKTGQGKRVIILAQSTAELLKERKRKSCSEWIFENPLDPSRPVSPDFGIQQNENHSKECRPTRYSLPRPAAHLRNPRSHKRSRCQNTVGNPRSHQCELHARHLYSRHNRYAEKSIRHCRKLCRGYVRKGVEFNMSKKRKRGSGTLRKRQTVVGKRE